MGLSDLAGLPRRQQISAYIWLAWIGSSLLGLLTVGKVIRPPMWILVSWGVFGFLYEVVASKIGHLTLSKVMQAIDDLAPQGVRWFQSYRGLANGLCALMSLNYGFIVSHQDGNWFALWPLGAVVAATLFLWNHPHWTKPEKFG